MKTVKYLAALLLLSSCFCFAQSTHTSNGSTSLSVVGTPDDPDIAHSIFPDAQTDDLFIAAGSGDETVRLGVRGSASSMQVTKDGTNVRGSFSINGIPLTLASKAPTGSCNEAAFVLSGDGLTVCNLTTHLYQTK